MSHIVNKRARGRPREFELEAAIEVGGRLFHEQGYDGVSVAQLTEAIGISPPSFYAAFGSKGAFFERAMHRYSATVAPLDRLLTPGRAPGAALREVLEAAARAYTEHPERRGCFVLEHARHGSTPWGAAARTIASTNREKVRAFLEASDVRSASQVADYVGAVMLGLSAAAREGWDEFRLTDIVDAAAKGLDRLVS